jgi:hypothetical protein
MMNLRFGNKNLPSHEVVLKNLRQDYNTNQVDVEAEREKLMTGILSVSPTPAPGGGFINKMMMRVNR